MLKNLFDEESENDSDFVGAEDVFNVTIYHFLEEEEEEMDADNNDEDVGLEALMDSDKKVHSYSITLWLILLIMLC